MLSRIDLARGSKLPARDAAGVRYPANEAPPPERIARLTLGDEDRPGASSPDDLALVAAHFAATVGADGWALTGVHDQGAAHCIAAGGMDEAVCDALLHVAARIEPALGHHGPAPIWCERLHASHAGAALVLPVPRTAGHACTFLNLGFDKPDEERRAVIERTCLREWPSVSAYLRLWQSTRVARRRTDGLEAGLNLVAIGIVLLSTDGHIVFANDTARLLMDRHDGIREHRGQVQATDRGDAAALSTAIGYVLAQSGVAERMPLLMLRREHGPPLVTSFVCAPPSEMQEEEGALLFFVDPGLDIHQLAEPVCKLFRLSRVETELACLLASGQTLATAAQSLHVKLGTARGYLKQVFVKTGSNRQVDLVRLIFSNLVRTSMSDHARRR